MFLFHKKIVLFVVFSAAILRGYAQDIVRMSLDEAVTYAMKNNNGIKNIQMGVRDAEELIQATKATGLPQVNAELGYNFFYQKPKVVFPASFGEAQVIPYTNFGLIQQAWATAGLKDGSGNLIALPLKYPQPSGDGGDISFVQRNGITGTLSASQLIFSGSYTVALKAANFARELAAVQVTSKEQEVRYQVADAYLPSLLITESVKTLDKNIANLEKLLKEVSATYKAGFVEQLDVDRLTLSLANLKSERDNLDRQKGLVINALKMVIGYPMDKDIEPTDDINSLLQPAAQEDLMGAIDYNNRKEYQVILTGEKLQKLNIDLNKAGYLPTVVGFANWTANLNSDNYFSKDKDTYWLPQGLVGFKASMSLWDNNEKKHKIERAKIALAQIQNQKSDFERAVTLQVMNARIAYFNAQRRVESQQKNLALAERIHKTTETKFKNGIGSSLEITTAEQQLYQAQQNVRQAQFDLLTAQKALQKALGK
ncbi:MAG: TolC family protein [Saprospiraceae bacterium]|nr:TolC family protein [Saprospiraceae bacterium]